MSSDGAPGRLRESDSDGLLQLAAALREARLCMADVSLRLDVETVGEAKWRLLRASDAITTALRQMGLEDELSDTPPAEES